MMLNENPVPPSDAVVEAITDIAKKGNRYPDRMLSAARQARRAARRRGREHRPGQRLVRDHRRHDAHLPAAGRRVPLLHPDVRDVPLAGRPAAAPRPSRSRCASPTCSTTSRACSAAVNEKTKLILIINPNNPTGIFIDDADLIKFCELGIPLCIDEAYLDYHPQVEAKVDLVKKYPHVFLSHTFSKAFGLAGMRFGYVVAAPERRRRLQPHVPALERQPHGHGRRRGHPRHRRGQGEGQVQQRLDGRRSSRSSRPRASSPSRRTATTCWSTPRVTGKTSAEIVAGGQRHGSRSSSRPSSRSTARKATSASRPARPKRASASCGSCGATSAANEAPGRQCPVRRACTALPRTSGRACVHDAGTTQGE